MERIVKFLRDTYSAVVCSAKIIKNSKIIHNGRTRFTDVQKTKLVFLTIKPYTQFMERSPT